MKKPKMILFDYGQTLLDEKGFDGVRGTKAVLNSCVENPENISAEEIQAFADELIKDIRKFHPEISHLCELEIHNHQFQNYLYEYFNIKTVVSKQQLEKVFWDAAAPGTPTVNIFKFLEYLKNNNIRIGIISNLSFSGETLTNRINDFFPNNSFEFILASSEYIFRKPHRRIFEFALRKANLSAEDVWYCGDNAVCDVDGAKNIGITPIWYKGALRKNKIMPQTECITVEDWRELISIIESL
jgi:putative hydrolase of the HAD superfamily